MAQAITARPGVYLLDRTSDASHNRSVFTMAGEHDAVMDALDRLVATAIHEIDMDVHLGEHPRIGAGHRLPFGSPPAAANDDCVQPAPAVGARGAPADDP